MSAEESPPEAEDSDHAYFQAVEEAFVRLRGAPLLLSPADWQVARRWHRQGIPVDLVVSTLTQLFTDRRERGVRGKVQSLRYCARAVEAAWRSVRELRVAGEREAAPGIDVDARLEALAAALPDGLVDRGRHAAAIRALTGSAARVEESLAALDEEVLAASEAVLDREQRSELEAEAEAALTRLAQRRGEPPGGPTSDTARARLTRRALRRRLGLPVLSLFSPEAEQGGSSPAD